MTRTFVLLARERFFSFCTAHMSSHSVGKVYSYLSPVRIVQYKRASPAVSALKTDKIKSKNTHATYERWDWSASRAVLIRVTNNIRIRTCFETFFGAVLISVQNVLFWKPFGAFRNNYNAVILRRDRFLFGRWKRNIISLLLKSTKLLGLKTFRALGSLGPYTTVHHSRWSFPRYMWKSSINN